jgi:hypothetical protein
MVFRWLRKRTFVTVTVATLAIATIGGLVLGAGDVSAAAMHRMPGRRVACIRQFIAGNRVRNSLDSLVQDGTLTADQETAVLNKLVDQATGKGTCTAIGLTHDHAVADAVATTLGMDRSAIKQAWDNGQSLTEIAQSNGVSRDELVSTIEQAIDAKLQKAVDGGKITAERKTEIESKLDPLVEQAVDLHKGERLNGRSATPVAPATIGTPAASSATASTV